MFFRPVSGPGTGADESVAQPGPANAPPLLGAKGWPQAAGPDPPALPFGSVPAATPRRASWEQLCSVAPALRSQVTLVAVAVGK